MIERHPIINGETVIGHDGVRILHNPYDGREIAKITYATFDQAHEAISEAQLVFHSKSLSPEARSAILLNSSKLLNDLREECARIITAESGKPITYSRMEVARAIFVLKASAEAALSMNDDLAVDTMGAANAEGKSISYRYFPSGVVAAITPFNFPLNLVMHKVAPAIACGCPVILKPAPQTPLTAFMLSDIFNQCGLPPGWLSIIPCENEVAEKIVLDERIKTLSFTGSAAVGWKLKSLLPKKKVTLELGGTAAAIVDEVEDLDTLVSSLCTAAFSYSGQVCISLQRLLIHRKLYGHLLDTLIETAGKIVVDDPMKDTTILGSMISESAAKKSWGWIEDALTEGAIKHCGEYTAPNFITPTILTNVKKYSTIYTEEAFAPVLIVEQYDDFFEAIDVVNNSKYGLQASLYSNDPNKIKYAYEQLEVGGIMINNSTTYRTDAMPYGGVKDSGFGREGITWAIKELCEVKVLVS